MKLRGQQFVLGVAAGLVAQAISALWHWLRAPALPPPPTALPPRLPQGAGKHLDGDRDRGGDRGGERAATGAAGVSGPELAPELQARVCSALPQRLRVAVPEVRADERYAAGLAAVLAKLPGVSAVSVNPRTGRALLLFAAPVDDLEAVLRAVVSAAENAAPLDADAPSPPGAGGGAGGDRAGQVAPGVGLAARDRGAGWRSPR